jgi:uncharacterized lipoprotein YmbA
MKTITVVLLLILTGCATTTHPPMKGVFVPHFKPAPAVLSEAVQ